jgi:hypothetical protein
MIKLHDIVEIADTNQRGCPGVDDCKFQSSCYHWAGFVEKSDHWPNDLPKKAHSELTGLSD